MGAILTVKDLNVTYINKTRRVMAVRRASFSIDKGDSLGIVGESGSGKSTLAMALLRLHPKSTEITGEALFDGKDLFSISEAEMNELRWMKLAVVFQKAMNALSPVHRISTQIEDIYRVHCPNASGEEIQERAREQMSEHQRDYYLREQMKAIQTELGEEADEIEEYREKIARAALPDEVREKLNKELGRLAKQSYSSSESTVLRNYLDICLELPWGKTTKEKMNVSAVQKALDQDHFGLDKVKRRILEFVAVKQLAPELKGQIICLVGPPGVGKTSIAMSMARAMNRKLARISLGGVSDEAEIRGHRKTYVGAMPGRIISAINQAQSCNPLILLDEIDKLGRDHRGDPASALLEVLDGEQNYAFRDHFLEIPLDLSRVLFITTANTTSTIPRPLLDRMEVIELSSYTDEEKVQIAKKHLLPKELKRHGLREAFSMPTPELYGVRGMGWEV